VTKNFYHGKDADIVAGAANFATLISGSASTYGLTSAQATSFGTLNTALQSAYTTAITPETRTPVAIEAKNLALINMRRNAILLARIIYSTLTVTNAQLVSLGLLPRTIPTPRPVPGTPPVIEVASVSGRLVNVRLHGAPPDSGRGKPFGAIGANIFSFVGDEPPSDPRQYHFEGMATRTITQVLFPNSVESGALVWLSASWVSARGQIGIGSTPISTNLQGGAILPEAA
jgi:hypothetical protein